MNSALLALSVLDVAGAALIAGLFFYFSSQSRDRYLKLWALAWSLTVGAEVVTANDLLGRPIAWAHNLVAIFGVGAPLAFVAGTAAFSGRKYSHWWTAAALGGAGTAGLLDHAGVDPFRSVTPVALVLACAIAAAAYHMFRSSPNRGSHRFAAVAMGAWAAHILTYPVVGPIQWLLPFGVALSALLQMATGLGLILAHLERGQLALKRKTQEERELIQHAAIGIYRLAADGRFLLANPALLKILGYSDFETFRRERSAADLFADPARGRQHLASLTDASETEAVWKRKDGSRIQVRITGRRVSDSAEEQGYIEGFATDVTDRRRLQAQLESASRLQAVGRLTGGIAHDFNNLLTVIEGNLTLQQRLGESPHVADAQEAGRRAAELTKQLLTFSRAQEDKSAVTDVVPQTKVLARLLQRAFPETVQLTVAAEVDSLSAAIPAPDLDQIVMNLVINSRDVLCDEAQGHVRIELGGSWAPGQVVLRVSDNGPGIDAELLPRLFEPFVTSRQGSGGTGLGLSIVKELVVRAHGSIQVYADAAFGTCFEVRLPEAQPHAQPRGANQDASRSGKILVVDDDDAVRRVTSRVLRSVGYEVLQARGVGEAKQKLSADLHAAVVDVVMTDGDGFDVLEEIERRQLELPALLMSGYPDAVLRARGAGAHAIVAKPFRQEQLLAALDAVIAAQRAKPGNEGAA